MVKKTELKVLDKFSNNFCCWLLFQVSFFFHFSRSTIFRVSKEASAATIAITFRITFLTFSSNFASFVKPKNEINFSSSFFSDVKPDLEFDERTLHAFVVVVVVVAAAVVQLQQTTIFLHPMEKKIIHFLMNLRNGV